MKLSRSEFKKRLKNGGLVLTLIGMSNIGKSFWCKKLTELDFVHLCCDDMIEKRLEPELKKLGFAGIHEVAKWMGLPFENQSQENQKKYLNLENKVLKKIINRLKNEHHKNIAIDTTGSYAHVEDQIPKTMQQNALVIHIKPPAGMVEAMFQKFITHPKPIIWGNKYRCQPTEDKMSALRRCYPKLLKYRTEQYKKAADIEVRYEDLPGKMTAGEFLEKISQE